MVARRAITEAESPASSPSKKRKVNETPPTDYTVKLVADVETYKKKTNETEPLPLETCFDAGLDNYHYTVSPAFWSQLKRHPRFKSKYAHLLTVEPSPV
jgi:hypothetical protein